MPAALATSDSVIDDQSRVISMSRMPSRIESRSSTRDASAYGTRGAVRRSPGVLTCARLASSPRRSLAPPAHSPSLRSPRPLIPRRFARPARSPTTSTISKSDFAAPQSGQLQSVAGCRPTGCPVRCRPPASPSPRRTRIRTARRRTSLNRSSSHRLVLPLTRSLRSRPSPGPRSPGRTSCWARHPRVPAGKPSRGSPSASSYTYPQPGHRRRSRRRGGRRRRSVPREDPLPLARQDVGPGHVTPVMGETRGSITRPPHRRHVGEDDHRGVARGQLRQARRSDAAPGIGGSGWRDGPNDAAGGRGRRSTPCCRCSTCARGHTARRPSSCFCRSSP